MLRKSSDRGCHKLREQAEEQTGGWGAFEKAPQEHRERQEEEEL